MVDIWIISDTHFNHKNILNFTNSSTGNKVRPGFENVEDMNEYMIKCWNSVVKPQDKVYHLGDVYFGNANEAMTILRRLNGKKRLVVGNHDTPKAPPIMNNFEKISLWRVFAHHGLLLTHVPVHPSTLGESRFTGNRVINVHGHTHQNGSPEGPYMSACVELIGYTPRHIDEFV